jgi:nicotinamidase/pyrazinamidase
MNASRRRSLSFLSGFPALAVFAAPLSAFAASETIGDADALIVVDVQNCFMPGGTLPVKEGDQVVPLINKIARRFHNVVITQDWHTPGHTSFASSHPGKKPFELIDVSYGKQVLWPDHCIQGTQDAALHSGLDIPQAQLIIRKGFHKDTDSYSAFLEADKKTPTGLGGYLKQRAIRRIYVCGLATDFCVAWTALDGRAAGFQVAVIEDASRAIDLNGSLKGAWDEMTKKGVRRLQSSDLL